jgi:two-component system CheB/CheR fusion protein
VAQAQDCSWQDEDARAFTELMLRKTRQHGVIFFDKELRIRGWNQGACFITGWTSQDVLGQSFAMTFAPEDRERKLPEHEAEVALETEAALDERWHQRKDGSRFWSGGVTVPLRSPSGEVAGFVKVFRDMTHLRARMKYLENQLRESNSRHHARDTFVGTIAHEMRNPLGPLHLALELMRRVPDEAGRYGELIRIMDRQVGFLQRLVEDLVDLTRVQTGKMSIAYGTVELQRFLGDACDECRPAADAKGVALHLLSPQVPIEIEVDPHRLDQVVVNLVNNALKFTERGGAVWVSATVDQTDFVVSVKDNGRGIAPDLLPKIFDVFTQAQGAGSERGAGLGIGLALVKEIVALHQGTVEVRSEGPGKGSEFILRIPQRRPAGSQPEPLPVADGA